MLCLKFNQRVPHIYIRLLYTIKHINNVCNIERKRVVERDELGYNKMVLFEALVDDLRVDLMES